MIEVVLDGPMDEHVGCESSFDERTIPVGIAAALELAREGCSIAAGPCPDSATNERRS